MTKDTTQQIIEEYKILINNLMKIQDKLFGDLEAALQFDDDRLNDYVFDYVYNSDNKSFKEYLNIYDPKYAQAYKQ